MPTPSSIAARPSILLAALGAFALVLAVVFFAYTVQAQGQEVTRPRLPPGRARQPSPPTFRSRLSTIRSASPGKRHRTKPSPTTRSCAATGTRTHWASST